MLISFLKNASDRNINSIQALTISEKFHIPHSYGKTVCRRCRQLVQTHVDFQKIEYHKKAFEWIDDVALNDDDSDDNDSEEMYDELQSRSSQISSIGLTRDLYKKKRELLNQYLYLCGSNKKIKTTNAYYKLQKKSKANFLASVRNLIEHILEFLAGNESTVVEREAFIIDDRRSSKGFFYVSYSKFLISESNKTLYDRQLVPVMRGIAEAYDNAENCYTRRSILSIVAPKISFSILQSFIPNITYYRFVAARMHASQAGAGVLVPRPPRVSCRYDSAQIEHFIDFILSNHVCTDMPFGEKTLVLSDGTKLHVPDTIRNFNSSRIITQYFKYTSELFVGFNALHESTLFKILSECKASTRRAITGLNYFVANGSDAFDTVFDLIDDLNLDTSEHRRLSDNIRKGKQYLKTDYKINVKRTSRVRDHCIYFALRDSTSSSFSTPCSDHDHDQVCSECSYLAQALEDVKESIKNSEGHEEEIKRKLYKFTLAQDAIRAWKCHQLRSVNQDLGRECILDVLGEDAIYLNLDFAMK